MERGHHKVFLGMAAGVGKTYRALADLRQASEAGRDAVVAYLEPHGRAETVAQASGLEVLPRRAIVRGTVELYDLDLPGTLRRAPEVCLVDELAHTNTPGLEHAKRYEDVADLLVAGIDVLSTVNVQHLESLNDVVVELTGVRVRETLPDRVLAEADEIEIVDLTPHALLDRLRAGKVYAPDRVQAALNGFFKIENLDALRELALRQVAEEVEARRLVRPVHDEDASAPVAERLLAFVAPGGDAEAVVRRAWRSAQRLQADLDVLVAVPAGPPAPESQAAVDALSRLVHTLGAELLVREGDDPVGQAVRVARERGTTYVLLGPPPRRRGLRRVGPSTIDRLLEELPGVDVRVVADRVG